jgi:hypothetical protein
MMPLPIHDHQAQLPSVRQSKPCIKRTKPGHFVNFPFANLIISHFIPVIADITLATTHAAILSNLRRQPER